jgi:hypothetical protein
MLFVRDYILDFYKRIGEDIDKMNVKLSEEAKRRMKEVLGKEPKPGFI